MPFIPHTENDVQQMLSVIGVDKLDDLFDEIPAALRSGRLQHTPEGVGEMVMLQRMQARADQDRAGICFLGAGSYDHHIPAAVWDLTARGEFMTAYTPYQAEASQGTLQLIYEYQSMMTELTGMGASNASVYDGASALGEAALMAERANKKSKARRILVADTVHPLYREAALNIVHNQGLTFSPLPVSADGTTDLDALTRESETPTAIVVQQPNFFGTFEAVDELTDWAHQRGALVIAVVNPLSLALLKPPGEWGERGADIVCGDGQPFGIPMSSGGPSFGFMCCRESIVRQMPGRIIGKTVDLEGKPGYALTLQAREQHIRRGKATSNICTNQGLLVTAGTIYLSLMGPQGLRSVAAASCANTRALLEQLTALPGVRRRHPGSIFHEAVVELPVAADRVVDGLLNHGVLGGLALGDYYPGMERCLLVCATEKRTQAEIAHYAGALGEVLDGLAAEDAA
jgi:glycine dehydrogenase subunit 1